MATNDDVTNWIARAKDGDGDAAQLLWERYVERLVALARSKLPGRARRAADEEDVVQNVFHSFFERARNGKFPRLGDRDDLWSLLVVLTHRKSINHSTRERAAKRGGGNIGGESILGRHAESGELRGLDAVLAAEPTPELAVEVAENFEALLASLGTDGQREVVRLRMEGYSVAEIATRMGISERSVARKLALARARIEENQ